MPIAVPVLRVLEACRGGRTNGPLILRPNSGREVDEHVAAGRVTVHENDSDFLTHLDKLDSE
ncbi:hypothetical protein C6I20_15915 [Aeromicrobium sp. A1-2]|uniref:hypothetical protein n=1 Tax=Aeromicrobium sp. A1-2 TaxID=2107713 RepID=UPI000E514857|nr:hypothetical protein [Aeromicrobium sp. A1-2]AXT86508.1 hypothetical protein C6I20_15915 [Aeromicrobium sp. A1-2]